MPETKKTEDVKKPETSPEVETKAEGKDEVEEVKSEIKLPNVPHPIGKHGMFYARYPHKVLIAHAEYEDEINGIYRKHDNGDPKVGYVAHFRDRTIDYNGNPIYVLDLNNEKTRYKAMAAKKLKEMGYPQVYEEHLDIIKARAKRAKERSKEDSADLERIKILEERMQSADRRRTEEQKVKNKMVMGLGGE